MGDTGWRELRGGNLRELAACMRRADRGEKLTIGFLGGSITQGAAASSGESCYARLVYRWWCGSFPRAEFSYVNAGIGGTTSHFGVARAEEDLLCRRPDVVVVDFSVNDEASSFFQETFEGLVRKLLGAKPRPAVLVLHNARYDDGSNAEEIHGEVADHYGLPRVSIRDTVWEKIKRGTYRREELSADGLHPNDKGHALVADEVIRALEEAKKLAAADECFGTEEPGSADAGRLSAPLTANADEGGRRIDARNGGVRLYGFVKDAEEEKEAWDFFRNGWLGRKEGDQLELELTGSSLAVQYRKSVRGKAPKAKLILDGEESRSFLLDGKFDEDWGDCLYLKPLLHHGTPGKHHIRVEIVEEGDENALPFYLLSFICA